MYKVFDKCKPDMAMGWANSWVGLSWVGSLSLRHAYSANVDSCAMHRHH